MAYPIKHMSVSKVKCKLIVSTAPDKRGYPHKYFYFSTKPMLLVLSRSASANEYPQHRCRREIRKNTSTFWLEKTLYLELC